LGLRILPAKKEIILVGSLAIIVYLMANCFGTWTCGNGGRSSPSPSLFSSSVPFPYRRRRGMWEIDALKFDEPFFGTLRQISSIFAIGNVRPAGWMSRHPIPYLVVFLSFSTPS